MNWIHHSARQLALPFGIALLAAAAPAQRGGRPPVDRQKMWPAPTAADWKKPCLITWQRTWKDAVALSRQTGKPILVCVNMDGEIASEHYAGVRYRQPEIAALYEPYVCVIASVYRHNPRDYDEQGRRILCPRFGSVTCGEHIAIEPKLYAKYFDGKRVAPRHIGVELAGQEVYDVYYTWDTDSVFEAIRKGITERTAPPPRVVRGDRSIVERVASPDSRDHTAVERAYLQGDRAQRRALLEAALACGDAAPVDLLRLAVFGFDTELSKMARRALARSSSTAAVGLIAEALRVPLEKSEREPLIAALERLGESSPWARTLAVVQRGLSASSAAIDVGGWSAALEGASAPAPPRELGLLQERVAERVELVQERPADAAAHLELAEASLALALDPRTGKSLAADRRSGRKYARLMVSDAQRAALEAEKLGASGWRVNAVVALAAFYLGDRDQAYARAETAVRIMPPGEPSWNAMAVLSLFAQARQRAIARALRAKKDWPAQWLADVHAAYAVIARHPLCTAAQIAAQVDFLSSLGARGQAERFLEAGLKRFADSWDLHARLRSRLLAQRGPDGLEAAYEARLRAPDAPAHLEWFAGYASLMAAEGHRRAGKSAEARAAYDRAIAHYERGIATQPETRSSADHYIAMALAGRARLACESGDCEGALRDLLASFARKPRAAANLDGLGFSPVTTAQLLRSRLVEQGRADLVGQLDAALARLDELDPALLRPPAFEREAPPGPANAQRRRRGRRRAPAGGSGGG